ncbi:hypothetical protein L5515_008619 [Caenorhabditis briggsae]|uniref:Uncharacterized protein n=1 Tax=Caenorhabditis briggsae TaxID=6238 RepID=A0AAE9A5P0_CAEBR|nr:hypothetical protein L3Y34_008779 [Caenorhabditis briggsae]UMM36463.1 hypothetical protein L5515_008619 [Caenorhabditis briggsae]
MRIALLLLLISGVHQANSLFKDRPLRTRKAATGPCTLNEDGLKCNENGYYETVQCNKDSCFCVTPHTGLIAFETRTNSPKTAPKCGACIGYLQKLFANGDTPDNSFIPKCDVAKGDFDPVQCDSSKNQCYCVDTDTGRETPGTRQPFNSTKNMNCMKIDFSIDSKLFPKFEKPDVTKPKPSLPVGRPWCGKDRHPGCTCRENKTSIRYWFDFETYSCLAFEHQGCGGNRNSYRTYGECISDCALQDFFSCALQSQPAIKSNGEWYPCPEGAPPPPGVTTTTTPGPKLDHYGCPKGYICMMGPFFGLCCEESLTIRYQDAFDTKCKNNKPKLQMIHHDSCSDLFGKSCSDNFCPRTHTCEHNEFVAYCCPK